MKFYDLLKASKGLPVRDPLAVMWGQQLTENWPVTEITGSLPLTFESKGGVLSNYRVYGTSEGAGEAIQLGIQLDEPLRGLGDIKDTLDVSTGVLTRRIGVVVLDGTDGHIPDGNTTRYFFKTIAETLTVTSTTDQLCSHYSYAIVATGTANVGFRVTGTSTDSTRIAIRSPDTDLDTTEKYRAFYASEYANRRPVTAYYVLANPVTEQVEVPQGLTGTIEGYLTQSGTPTESVPIYPEANGVELPNGKYEVYADVYKIPLTVSGNNSQSQSYDAYIGSSKLYDEEYLDYESGKVYKRTTNKLSPIVYKNDYYISEEGQETYNSPFNILSAKAEGNTTYTLSFNFLESNKKRNCRVHEYANGVWVRQLAAGSNDTYPKTFATSELATEIRIGMIKSNSYEMLNTGSTAEPYAPYLQPTDPPVPFEAIQTFSGENTLSSTETVGEVSVTGRIKEQEK